MEPYLFLFGIGIAWLVFATVQDLKTREVANWLTFSLIFITLAYRGFISFFSGVWGIFLWGIIGCAAFVGCAYIFYYGRVFAGGDAKLLMGLGIALPYQSGSELLLWGSIFLFALFFGGAIYTLVYSIWLVISHWQEFKKKFKVEIWNQKWLIVFAVIMALVLFITLRETSMVSFMGIVLILIIPFLYIYLQAVEQACMISLTRPEKLREGDWMLRPIKVAGRTIHVSVHGLSLEDIALLRKNHKSVFIKQGVPFVPAFLLAYSLMVFFFLTEGLDSFQLSSILSSLVLVFS